MRKIGLVLLLALTTLVFAGCNEDDLVDLNPGLAGTVRNAVSRNPVPDASVTLQGRTRMTNAQGIFVFTDLEPGRHTIRVERTGFQTITREIEVRDS